MNKTLALAIGLSVLSLVVAFVAITKTPEAVYNTVEQLGAQAVQVTDGPECFLLNGLHECWLKKPLVTATTTPCSIRSPLNATSTLVYAGVEITTSTTTASVWTFSRNTNAFATSSTLLGPSSSIVGPSGGVLVPSGEYGNIFLTGTSTDSAIVKGDMGNQVAPGTWVNWGIQGISNIAGGDASLLKGSCFVKFVY